MLTAAVHCSVEVRPQTKGLSNILQNYMYTEVLHVLYTAWEKWAECGSGGGGVGCILYMLSCTELITGLVTVRARLQNLQVEYPGPYRTALFTYYDNAATRSDRVACT